MKNLGLKKMQYNLKYKQLGIKLLKVFSRNKEVSEEHRTSLDTFFYA